jgi:hypothetical protein
MVDETSSKKKDDFMGIDKGDLALGLSATAVAGLIAFGIKTYMDMQRTGQLPNLFPNPALLAQQQQEMVNQQIAAQAQADAQQEIQQQAAAPPEAPPAIMEEGIRTVPRRGHAGFEERINI